MKRFLIKLLVFAGVILCVDYAIGKVCDAMVKKAKGGDFHLNNYVNNEMRNDVLFMGSSRCMHHYIPQIVDDSLGVNSFNCGTDGMGIPFMYARYKMITERYKPKVIFYDVYLTYDLAETAAFPNTRNLKWLKAYYNRNGVGDVFQSIESTSKYKMMSRMYRYNSDVLKVLQDCIKPSKQYAKGYRPLDGEMKPEHQKTSEGKSEMLIDSLKLSYWEKFMQTTKEDGVQLVLIYSPLWGTTSSSCYAVINNLAEKYEIPVIDHYSDAEFVNNSMLFSEPWHLNGIGAEKYTKSIIKDIREYLQ